MSMKRVRRANNSTKQQESEGPLSFTGQAAPVKTWDELVGSQPDEAFKPYALSTTFAKNDLLAHSKFGRGIVTLVENSRIEVLFQDASRKLGHATV